MNFSEEKIAVDPKKIEFSNNGNSKKLIEGNEYCWEIEKSNQK